MGYDIFPSETGIIKAWTQGVSVDEMAKVQLRNLASLPFVTPHVAVMPDVHVGIGATVGSVVPTKGAIIPAAVGVDIGCGMIAVRTDLTSKDLPDSLAALRSSIERTVPHGRTMNGGRGDRGSWGNIPEASLKTWKALEPRFDAITFKHRALHRDNDAKHLGTLGTGNHFIELCLDKQDRVWVMLHSGSRGVGNRIGTYFIELAKRDMERHGPVPDKDLSYLVEGSQHFDDYVEAVAWAQDFARENRALMLDAVLKAMAHHFRPFSCSDEAVNCHHNYVSRETHFGEDLWVTRKGAVRAGKQDLGIIPGSMGTRSYIVRGKGNADSFCSCSHGAGRKYSRTQAKKLFTVADQEEQTRGIECRKDKDVIDEIPAAYKPIEDVIAAQSDLIEVVHELRQVLCVKG